MSRRVQPRRGVAVPGIRAGYIARNELFDRSFHAWWRPADPLPGPGGSCWWCDQVRVARAGGRVVMGATDVWAALFSEQHPRLADDWKARTGRWMVDFTAEVAEPAPDDE